MCIWLVTAASVEWCVQPDVLRAPIPDELPDLELWGLAMERVRLVAANWTNPRFRRLHESYGR